MTWVLSSPLLIGFSDFPLDGIFVTNFIGTSHRVLLGKMVKKPLGSVAGGREQWILPITIRAETPRSRVDGVIFVRDFPSCPQGMLAVGPKNMGGSLVKQPM